MLASGNRAANTWNIEASVTPQPVQEYHPQTNLIDHTVDNVLIQALVLEDSKDTPSTPPGIRATYHIRSEI